MDFFRVKILSAVAGLSLLAGCSGGVPISRVPVETMTAAEIYDMAEQDLARGDADRAAHFFGEIERLYPYSTWAKRALVMQAFSFHRDRDYASARASAGRFLEFYPADGDAAYAQYLMGLSYYDQIDDVGRDQELTIEALRAFATLIENYPSSEYSADARQKFDLSFDHLAAKEMEVGRYYLKKGHFSAAANRFRAVVENFETSRHTPEALYRLVEAYLSLGLHAEAQTAAAILGHNFRASEWYKAAYELLTGRGLDADGSTGGWLGSILTKSARGEWI